MPRNPTVNGSRQWNGGTRGTAWWDGNVINGTLERWDGGTVGRWNDRTGTWGRKKSIYHLRKLTCCGLDTVLSVQQLLMRTK